MAAQDRFQDYSLKKEKKYNTLYMFVQKLYIVRSRIYKILASFQKMFNIYSSNPILFK